MRNLEALLIASPNHPMNVGSFSSPAQAQESYHNGAVYHREALSGLSRYAQIAGYQTYAGLKAEVSRTYLGVAWWLLEPTLAAVTMHFVFGLMLSNGSSPSAVAKRADFFPFLLVGTFAWQWFQGSVLLAANSIIHKVGVMQQVYLPKAIFPLVSVLNGTWKFLCTFGVMTVALWCLGYRPGAPYLALPVIILIQFGLNLAVGLPLAVWIPYFRDGTTVIGALLGFVGLASGIFFRPYQVPERYAAWVHLNPVGNLLTAYRAVLLEGQWPDWGAMGRVALIATVLLTFGAFIMRRFDLEIAKVAT